MAIDKIFNDANVDGIADNIFGAVNNSVSEVKAMQQRKAAENVQMVVEAFKKIETNITEKFDNVTDVIEKRVLTIKDGRDGSSGSDGRNGRDGKPGRDGVNGKQGPPGTPGKDGVDGEDGVSVTNANIDFDGSLVISLSTGQQINVGEVVAPDLAEKIKIVSTMSTNGAVGIKDEGSSISTGVKNINFVGATVTATASGDDVTVNVSAGTGTVQSVAATVPAFLSVAGSPITTTGTLAISLSGTALPVANGGTGLSSGTSGGVLAYTAAGTLASSTALAANALVIGGGAGAAPSTTTTGTGVVTALGVNTGTAGAFVVNGGALGTPSSGTVTNLTGTASININGTVGATTPGTGAFTTLSATGTLSGGTSGTAYSFSGSAPATSLTLTSGGDLGIGTSSPAQKLNVVGNVLIEPSAAFGYAEIKNQTSTAGSILRFTNGSTTSYFGKENSAGTYTWSSGGTAYATVICAFASTAPIQFGHNSPSMTLDSSGNLGIGTTSPGVFGVTARNVTVANSAGYAYLQLQGASANGGAIDFGDTSVRHAEIASFSGSSLAFYTNTSNSGNTISEKARIDSSGNLLVGVATANANGGVLQLKSGITFPATQSASTDANTLDDYEEGTWTPTCNAGATLTPSGSPQYVKIGKQVTIHAEFSVSVNASGTQFQISGLPFASNNSTGNSTGVVMGYFATDLAAYLPNNASTITFQNLAASANKTNIELSGKYLIIACTYFSA